MHEHEKVSLILKRKIHKKDAELSKIGSKSATWGINKKK